MGSLGFAVDYAGYYLSAQNKHDIHSPFVFNLTTKVINKECRSHLFDEIEGLRERLKNNTGTLNFTDYGAGGSTQKNKTVRISDIAKNAAKQPRYSRLLYRLVEYFQPKNILELGTSLGLSSLYMAKANESTQVTTLEGSDEVADLAIHNFEQLKATNIKLVKGPFENTLVKVVNESRHLDFVFFDGNHQKRSTLDYFETCLPKKHDKSVFIFDDINWSPEMKEAWTLIKNHHEVFITVDLFMMGLVFFNPDFSKEHFRIRF